MSMISWFKALFSKKDNQVKAVASYTAKTAKVSTPMKKKEVTKNQQSQHTSTKKKANASTVSAFHNSTRTPLVREESFFHDNGRQIDLVDVIAVSSLFRDTSSPQQETEVEVAQPQSSLDETCQVNEVRYHVDEVTKDVVEETVYECAKPANREETSYTRYGDDTSFRVEVDDTPAYDPPSYSSNDSSSSRDDSDSSRDDSDSSSSSSSSSDD